MDKTVLKKYKGCVDIRSHERQHCIDTKQNMIITHRGEQMTLTPRELKNKVKAKSQLFMKGKEGYHLYSYTWKPDNQE